MQPSKSKLSRSLRSAAFLASDWVANILAVGKQKKVDKSFMCQKNWQKFYASEKPVLILPFPTHPIERGWSLSANTDLWKWVLDNNNNNSRCSPRMTGVKAYDW